MDSYGSIGCPGWLWCFWGSFWNFFFPDIEPEATIILRTVGFGIGMFLVILSAPEIIGGIGLLKRLEWARILTLVVAFFNLISFPFGTALGVYSIVILFKEETVQLFKSE